VVEIQGYILSTWVQPRVNVEKFCQGNSAIASGYLRGMPYPFYVRNLTLVSTLGTAEAVFVFAS
jgi:hypothetical protein